ncbi:S-layer homology domain-containing protein [Paenibacillus alkalitolerans]|uniref:S-layer homology domain-containing protein n=1 Tax=Paenibacillus alkalitolerans TaxID=2799335 RepID=UPI0018F70468|nr:S-layer homology domain-containing protein [Paenibacillus alkalitolerans]
MRRLHQRIAVLAAAVGIVGIVLPIYGGDGVAAGSEKPENIVLTWESDPRSSVSVTWRTSSASAANSVVEIVSAEDGGTAKRFSGTSFAHKTDEGAMRIHEVDISGLKAGTSYTYRAGDGTESGWSQPGTFKTEEEDEARFTFLFTTDTQAVPNASATNGYGIWGEIFGKALKQYPDAKFMLLSGDIVDYGNKQRHWDFWFEAAKAYLPRLPIVPVVGNHDAVGEGEANFRAQFQLPRNGPAGEEELAYSFDYGNTHIAVLNSEGDLVAQAAWLKKDMNASDKLWKIVSMHHSPFPSHPDRMRESRKYRSKLVPVFDEAGIDLVLTGHDHAYMRSWPRIGGKFKRGAAAFGGTTYIIGGTAGPKFYSMANYGWMRVKFDENIQIYSGITVDGNELRMKVTTRDGRTADAFTMRKFSRKYGTYADVGPSHWAYGILRELTGQNIFSGATLTEFRPQRPVTRAEFATLLVRALGLEKQYVGKPVLFRFNDVGVEDWFAYTVHVAAEAGIASGMTVDRFEPNRAISREEMAAMLMRAYGAKADSAKPEPAASAPFADIGEASGWARMHIVQASALGLVNETGAFKPKDKATRAESAAVIYNLLHSIR